MDSFSKIKKGQYSEFVAAGWLVKQNYLALMTGVYGF